MQSPVRLIPFRYNSEDAVMIELGNYTARFWAGGQVWASASTPYWMGDLHDLKYVQSGNMVFFAHRKYPLKMLTRRSMTDWVFEDFPFEGGPWIPSGDFFAGDPPEITLVGSGPTYTLVADQGGVFTPDRVGSLIRLDMEFPGGDTAVESEPGGGWTTSEALECRSTYTLETHNHWRGEVVLERSINDGNSWTELKRFTRGDTQTEGQILFSGSETEPDVLFRVRVRQYEGSWQPVFCTLSVSGYIKTLNFRILSVSSNGMTASASIILDEGSVDEIPEDATVLEWFWGAWGGNGGNPAAVGFYQDRLVLAGTADQPQTVWLSRIGDYKNFSTSDPLRDDDAITLTLAADDMDGIHSIVSMSDLLVFTPSSEWRISGAGENGAISPKAVVAHQQAEIGSRSIQPIVAGGRVIMVQTHGTEVHALGYSLERDGYAGSDISILSHHLFEWQTREGHSPVGREILAMGYQQVPDSLLWFVLEDGTAAVCTYNPEHEVVGWSRQETHGRIGTVACLPGDRQTELWASVYRDGTWYIERLARRSDEAVFDDAGHPYESVVQSLRVTYEGRNGSAFTDKKLISRLVVSAIRSREAWVAPAPASPRGVDPWEKRRKITWDWFPCLTHKDIQLDNGFGRDGAIQIRTTEGPLTIGAISPVVTPGG